MEEYFIINKSMSGNATICDMLISHTEPKTALNETVVVTDKPCVPVSYTNTEGKRCLKWFMLLRFPHNLLKILLELKVANVIHRVANHRNAWYNHICYNGSTCAPLNLSKYRSLN
jgi:hypothetical protein